MPNNQAWMVYPYPMLSKIKMLAIDLLYYLIKIILHKYICDGFSSTLNSRKVVKYKVK